MKKIVILALILGLAGCASLRERFGGNKEAENSLPYKAERIRVEDPRLVQVAVTAPEGATVDQLRESVRFQATAYCIKTFGNSDTEWTTDPATGDWAFTRQGEVSVFTGRCTAD